MKFILYACAIILLYAGYYIVRIIYYSHYSPLPVIEQSETILGNGSPKIYIAAGDSTAAGEGASSTEHTYTYKIAKYLSQKNSITYSNVAVRGAKTADVLHEQIPKIIAAKPDIITVSVGANDLTHLLAAETILEQYKKIAEELQSKTSATIYMTNLPNFNGAKLLPFWYVAILEHRSRGINEKLISLENDRVKIINIHDYGWGHFENISQTYAADNFHPNDIGYQNWANAFLEKISE